jgi:multidrug efflux system membrane fusion protein
MSVSSSETSPAPGRHRAGGLGFWLIVLAILGTGGWFVGRGASGSQGREAVSTSAPDAPVPVVVQTVALGPVPIVLTGIGSVQPYNSVQVRARVDGEIVELRFKEGEQVAAGTVLAVLDRRVLEANLQQMQANLAREQAQFANTKADLDRLQSLKDFASRQRLDTQAAQVAQEQAQVAAAAAQVDSARTQLDYAVITSPIAGRTGLRQIDLGNIVHAGDAKPIVTINQIQPIAVVFTLNADDLPAVTKATASGELVAQAYAKDRRTRLADGRLEVVDNQIDQATGTVKLKAAFANADSALWPGQFVNVRLQVSVKADGIAIPASAVQRGPNSTYVWLVGDDMTVQMAPVSVTYLDDGRALAETGLTAGQTIVVDGQYKLRSGAKVAPAAMHTAWTPPGDAARR